MSIEKDFTFELDLLENGIDFILKGIDELFDNEYFLHDPKVATQFSTENYKYGCLHLFAGFLLVLKERLSRHMPELIYKGSLSEVRTKIKAGKFPNTVDFDELIERLEIGPRVAFAEAEFVILRKMQTLRNTLEHARVEFNKHEVWGTLSTFLDVVDRFLTEELNIGLENHPKAKNLSNKIKKIDHAWERIEANMKAAAEVALLSKLTEFQSKKQAILDELQDEMYDSSSTDPDFIVCRECGEEDLLTSGEFAGICTRCESVQPLTFCARCGEVTPGYDWDPDICESCKDYIANQ